MKIDTLNSGQINTDKKSDIEALITEKSYDLYKLCVENGVYCVIATKYMIHHHIVLEKGDEVKNGVIWIGSLGFRRMLGLLDSFIKRVTQNHMAILPNQQIEGEEWKKE